MPVLAFTFFGGEGKIKWFFFEFQLGETQVNLHQLGEFQEHWPSSSISQICFGKRCLEKKYIGKIIEKTYSPGEFNGDFHPMGSSRIESFRKKITVRP